MGLGVNGGTGYPYSGNSAVSVYPTSGQRGGLGGFGGQRTIDTADFWNVFSVADTSCTAFVVSAYSTDYTSYHTTIVMKRISSSSSSTFSNGAYSSSSFHFTPVTGGLTISVVSGFVRLTNTSGVTKTFNWMLTPLIRSGG
jgi:hypothetical protein